MYIKIIVLVFCAMFNRSLFVLFSFGHCIICPSMYGFCLSMLLGVTVMVLNATLNNISAIELRSVLLVDETGVHGENSWPATSNCIFKLLLLRWTCNVLGTSYHSTPSKYRLWYYIQFYITDTVDVENHRIFQITLINNSQCYLYQYISNERRKHEANEIPQKII